MRPASRMTRRSWLVTFWRVLWRTVTLATLVIGGSWMSGEAFTKHTFDIQNFCQGSMVFLVGVILWVNGFIAETTENR